jgi:phosphotransferase system enzyme I (PtsI)
MPLSTIRAERTFHGTPVSDGVARGIVRVVGRRFEEPRFRVIPQDWIEMEADCFRQALGQTRAELERLIARLDTDGDRHAREIIEMHLMVLDDSTINDQVLKLIREERSCAEHAYYRIAKECMDAFARIPDAYLRERALDIKDVAQRVLRHLTGDHKDDHLVDDPAVCIAHDLTPSETAQLDRKKVLGFAVELGSRTSHTAIVARSLGLDPVGPPWTAAELSARMRLDKKAIGDILEVPLLSRPGRVVMVPLSAEAVAFGAEDSV